MPPTPRVVGSTGGRPIDLLDTDCSAMIPPPPVNQSIGPHHRTRLARDYYVSMDAVDYSVTPRVIGRFVDVAASPNEVVVTRDEILCRGRSLDHVERRLPSAFVDHRRDRELPSIGSGVELEVDRPQHIRGYRPRSAEWSRRRSDYGYRGPSPVVLRRARGAESSSC